MVFYPNCLIEEENLVIGVIFLLFTINSLSGMPVTSLSSENWLLRSKSPVCYPSTNLIKCRLNQFGSIQEFNWHPEIWEIACNYLKWIWLCELFFTMAMHLVLCCNKENIFLIDWKCELRLFWLEIIMKLNHQCLRSLIES